MRKSITSQFVLAIVGVTMAVLAGTLALAWWSFQFGFLTYINAQEAQRLTITAEDLSQWYLDNGDSWQGFDERIFQRIINRHSMAPQRHPPLRGGPGAGDGGPRGFPPPPRGRPLSRSSPKKPNVPTWLVSIHGDVIAGRSTKGDSKEWINAEVSANDAPVAYLRTPTRSRLSSPLEAQFAGQQLQATAIIGVLALLLATVIALWLARTLLAPIKRTITGVDRLVRGDFSSRIDESRGDELGALMRDIDRLAASLESNQSTRQRWFADVSHELRTPISILHAELEAIRDGVRPLSLEQLESFEQEVTRLQGLVNDLYDLALSDLGGLRYDFAVLDIQALLQDLVEDCERRHPSLEFESALVPFTLKGDRKRLEQLFTNVLENACAYTDTPGRVRCHTLREGSRLCIKIEDSPPGVPEHLIEHLFEPLYRLESARDRRRGGAGLGLAICANITNAHGGSIAAGKSDLGGLRVEIWLEGA